MMGGYGSLVGKLVNALINYRRRKESGGFHRPRPAGGTLRGGCCSRRHGRMGDGLGCELRSGGPGFDVAGDQRHGDPTVSCCRGGNAAILVLTARDATNDKVENFEAGADDYLTKPFAFAELLVRVKALLRRPPPTRNHVLRVADLELDRLTQQVRRAGKRIELTAKEYSLLEYLAAHPGRVLSRTMIIEHVWDESFEGLTNIVDVYVRHLRVKVDSGAQQEAAPHRARRRLLSQRRGGDMNPRSLPFRLVAWYALWLSVVFVIASTLVYFGLRRGLWSTASPRRTNPAGAAHRHAGIAINPHEPEQPGRGHYGSLCAGGE